ncbi:MAG TPA: hypothetical protein VJS91_04950 [Nitrososphaeraceae archaeon]|nr:hypothetical protein [Nitrososphaeraceae archaeon]
MTSSRRSSVQRHIDNYNIHNGLGQVVPYVQYSMGIRAGKYLPQNAPPFTRSKASFFDRGYDKIVTEVENQIVREVAKRIYNGLSGKEAFFNELEKMVTKDLIMKNLNDILKGSNL